MPSAKRCDYPECPIKDLQDFFVVLDNIATRIATDDGCIVLIENPVTILCALTKSGKKPARGVLG